MQVGLHLYRSSDCSGSGNCAAAAIATANLLLAWCQVLLAELGQEWLLPDGATGDVGLTRIRGVGLRLELCNALLAPALPVPAAAVSDKDVAQPPLLLPLPSFLRHIGTFGIELGACCFTAGVGNRLLRVINETGEPAASGNTILRPRDPNDAEPLYATDVAPTKGGAVAAVGSYISKPLSSLV